MVSSALTSALNLALAALTIAAPTTRDSLPSGENIYLALNTTSGSIPLYAEHSSAGSFDLVFRPGAYYEGTPAILVNSTYIVFDTGDDLPYGMTQPDVGRAVGTAQPVTAEPGVGTGGLSVYNGLLEPKLFAAEELWVACGATTNQYTWEFAAEGDGTLPSGCYPATVQVYTRI